MVSGASARIDCKPTPDVLKIAINASPVDAAAVATDEMMDDESLEAWLVRRQQPSGRSCAIQPTRILSWIRKLGRRCGTDLEGRSLEAVDGTESTATKAAAHIEDTWVRSPFFSSDPLPRGKPALRRSVSKGVPLFFSARPTS
jgi:hypothetical protein